MFSLPELEAALSLVHESFPGTPQYAWPLLAERSGAEVWVKHENHTPTGAFKLRGGLIYAERLRRERPEVRGIVSATRGNHGQSLAWAGRRYGIAVTVVVPHGNSVEKNAAMRAFGARLVEHGDDFEMAREEAARIAVAERLEFAPSFAPDLVKGVATYALELFRAAPPLDALYVPIGLGSGICGAIMVRDLLGLNTEIIGVQATGAPAYARSFAEGRVVALNRAETQADGVAVRQPDPDAFAIIRERCVAHRHRVGRRDRRCDPGVLDRHAQSGGRRRRGAACRAVAGSGAHGGQARRPGDQRRQYRSGAVSQLGVAVMGFAAAQPITPHRQCQCRAARKSAACSHSRDRTPRHRVGCSGGVTGFQAAVRWPTGSADAST